MFLVDELKCFWIETKNVQNQVLQSIEYGA